MDESSDFYVMFNQLIFMDVEIPELRNNTVPNFENIIQFLCTPGITTDAEVLVERYKEISIEEKRLSVVPAEKRILSKLVWPLRQAKGCYMLGNYLGTVSLCGMVAEMLSILMFEMCNFTVNGKIADEKSQIGLFGSSFEKLGQNRRVSILHTYGIIDDVLKESFDIIRTTRRKYLHIFSQGHENLPQDSIKVFVEAVKITVKVIGQEIRKGELVLNPALVKYIQDNGEFIRYTPDRDYR